MLFSTHVNHASVSPTYGIGPTQGQRETVLVLVHIHCREFDIFNSHGLCLSDLVAQSVEQW